MDNINQNAMNQPKVNINDTQMVTDGDNAVYSEGILLRKVSRFLAGTDEDQLVPIPIVYNVKTGKPLFEMIPAEVRQEYIEFYENQK